MPDGQFLLDFQEKIKQVTVYSPLSTKVKHETQDKPVKPVPLHVVLLTKALFVSCLLYSQVKKKTKGC